MTQLEVKLEVSAITVFPVPVCLVGFLLICFSFLLSEIGVVVVEEETVVWFSFPPFFSTPREGVFKLLFALFAFVSTAAGVAVLEGAVFVVFLAFLEEEEAEEARFAFLAGVFTVTVEEEEGVLV